MCFVYTARDTSSEVRDAAPSLSGYAYDELKRGLLIGDFALGRRMGETRLSEQLGVSRTPVREALSRLHAEGLLLRLPEGGFSPAAPDLQVIAELYEVRRSLEFTALARNGHNREALTRLASCWSAMEPPATDGDCGPDFVLEDERFHVSLAEAAGNRSLADMLRHVNERIRIVRMQDFLTADRVAKTIVEHGAIVDALLESPTAEPARATILLSDHLHISERVVEQRASLALARMMSGPSHA